MGRFSVFLLALLAAGLAPAAAEPVAILVPPAGPARLGPTLDVELTFAPSLAADERVEATVFTGVDSPDPAGLARWDLAGQLALDPGQAGAWIADVPLAPGRNTLQVRRFRAGSAQPWAAATRELDREGFSGSGPHPFGVGRLEAQLTRPATASPGAPRTLDLLVWYPSDDPTLPDHPVLGGALGAPLASGAASLPVVLFSHGNCGVAFQSTFLTVELARAGFVVVAMSHTGNTALDPGCNDLPNVAVALVERPDDVIATLDWLLARAADPGSLLHGAVDPARVAVAGHSFGGQTTYRTAALDPRVRAAMPLAPEFAFTEPLFGSLLPLSIPTLVQGASEDGTTPFVAHQVALFDRLVAPRFLVELLGEGHLAFTDLASPETWARVNRFALGFLGTHGRRDRRWSALLTPTAGVVYVADAPPLPEPTACADGLDQDGDGSVDADDPGCTGPADASEATTRDVPGAQLALGDVPGRPDRRSLRLRSEDLALPTPGGPGDPTLGGAVLRVRNPTSGESMRIDLPAAGWRTLGRQRAFRGFGFRNPGEGPDCQVVLRGATLRLRCVGRDVALDLDEPAQGSLAVGVQLGAEPMHCMLFGGRVLRDEGGAARRAAGFHARDAPAPADCPLP